VLDSAQALIMAMRKLGVDPEDPANRVSLPPPPPLLPRAPRTPLVLSLIADVCRAPARVPHGHGAALDPPDRDSRQHRGALA
jgi:hypothetical protein